MVEWLNHFSRLDGRFGLFQTVGGLTRAAGTQQASQLELMFIDKTSLVDSCQVLSPLADHSHTLLLNEINFFLPS